MSLCRSRINACMCIRAIKPLELIVTLSLNLEFLATMSMGDRDDDCETGNDCVSLEYYHCRGQGGMGYKLNSSENPFGVEAIHCQK